MDRTKVRYPFYAALVAVASFVVTFFVCAIALPKMSRVLHDSSHPHVMPPFISAIESTAAKLYYWYGFHVVAGLVLAAMVLAAVPRLPEKLRRFARRFLMVASLLLFTAAVLAMFAQLYFSMQANSALQTRVMSYQRTLEEFAMLEEAEGRLEAVNDRFRALIGQEMVMVDSADDLSRSERRQQVARLSKILNSQPHLDLASAGHLTKAVLATLLLFRDDVKTDSATARLIIEHVDGLADQPIGDVAAAFDWIESQDESGDWTPLPLMKMAPREGLR